MSIVTRIMHAASRGVALSKLGADPFSRMQLFLLPLSVACAERLPFPLRQQVRIRMFGRTCALRVERMSDYAVLREVFLDEDYREADVEHPRVIVDVGSNIGASVAYWALRYPEARIYAVEPDPTTFARLEETIRQFPQVTAYAYAVTDANAPVELFSYPQSHLSSSLFRRNRAGGRAVTVEGRTLASLLEEVGGEADIVKFDIEGAEARMFPAGTAAPASVRLYIGEVHEDLIEESVPSFAQRFSGYSVEIRPTAPYRAVIIARRTGS